MTDGARNFHKAMRDEHTRMHDCMKGMHETCMKTTDDVDLAKLFSEKLDSTVDATIRAAVIRKGAVPNDIKLVARAGETLPSTEPISPELAEMFDASQPQSR